MEHLDEKIVIVSLCVRVKSKNKMKINGRHTLTYSKLAPMEVGLTLATDPCPTPHTV
jgi:hypothetical protein